MKKLSTLFFSLLTVAAVAQVPTNFGSNAEDGILYQTYNLIDHGTVSSVRFQAQNAIAEGDGTWEFYTGDYMNNWRPYTADDTLSGFDAIIDPSAETASARYNSNYGGETGKLPAVQAGYYYTAIVQTGAGDNFMSIIETDFSPVAIDTIIVSPENPTVQDNITITVQLDGAMMLSQGEHVFIRASADGYVSSFFFEITNFSNGVGTYTVPAGTIPAGTTINHYGLVTEESVPDAATIDYFTLFFANNGGNNFEFTVSAVTGIEDVEAEYGIIQSNKSIAVRNTDGIQTIELISIDGKLAANTAVTGGSTSISTEGLAKGVYVLNLIGREKVESLKLFVD